MFTDRPSAPHLAPPPSPLPPLLLPNLLTFKSSVFLNEITHLLHTGANAPNEFMITGEVNDR